MKKTLAVIVFAAWVAGMAPPAEAEEQVHVCKLVDVTVFNDRVHARCSNAAAGGLQLYSPAIYFFAIPTSNEAAADRFLSVAMTALVSQKTFLVVYDFDATKTGFGVSSGCKAKDCRVPLRFSIQ